MNNFYYGYDTFVRDPFIGVTIPIHPGVFPSLDKTIKDMRSKRPQEKVETVKCTGKKCGKRIPVDESYKIRYGNGKTQRLCMKCYLKYSKRNPGSGSYLR
jgi:hypothetical protein